MCCNVNRRLDSATLVEMAFEQQSSRFITLSTLLSTDTVDNDG